MPVCPIDASGPLWHSPHLPGNLFTPLQNHDFNPATPARGIHNYGYTFFENELTGQAQENARCFDWVFAGSSWCCQRMREKNIENTSILIQGVDSRVFHREPIITGDERFLVFSGGKFELRKGQDLVLRAFQILQDKYPDITLVNAWFNHWPASMLTMASSPHIRFEAHPGAWLDQMNHLYHLNGIDPRRVMTLPLLPQEKMTRVYQLTDVGLFPNRCEGGTNLVMMEYMACGKPVVASYTSGHCDILHEGNALLLKQLRPFTVVTPDRCLAARWETATLDEILDRIEYAYHHRDAIKQLGRTAEADMRRLTWAKTAQTVLHTLHPPSTSVA